MATIGDAIQSLDNRIAFIESGKPIFLGARSALGQSVGRIFEDGEKSDGSQIGTYNSTNELWVNPNTLPRKVQPRGKPGKERNVQNRKTVYFKSYKDLRSEQGRESEKVNLRLTNDLQSDYANAQITGGGIAQNPQPIKVSAMEYKITLKRQGNIDKKAGLEKRYGKIFNLTQGEKNTFYDVVRKEVALNA